MDNQQRSYSPQTIEDFPTLVAMSGDRTSNDYRNHSVSWKGVE